MAANANINIAITFLILRCTDLDPTHFENKQKIKMAAKATTKIGITQSL